MPNMCGILDPRSRTVGAGGIGRVEEEITGITMAGSAVRTAGPTPQKRGFLVHVTICDRMSMVRLNAESPTDPVELAQHFLICIAIHRTSSLAGDARLLEVRFPYGQICRCFQIPGSSQEKSRK